MSRETLFGGAAGGGKALHIDSIIPTPSGFVPLHQLKCSDFVFGMDGRPTQILAITPVMTGHQCWKLTFDDGSSVVADNDHIWLTYNAKELAQLTRLDPAWRAKRRAKRKSRSCVGAGTKVNHTYEHRQFLSDQISERNRVSACAKLDIPRGSLRTTSEIASTLKTANGRLNHAIPICEPIDTPDSSLPIDPYVLGCWLGDGCSHSAYFTSADEEIIDNIRDVGWQVIKKTAKYQWRIGTINERGANNFSATLRKMGLIANKHVPAEYLMASRSQRLALLQGLMDTDGTVAKHSGAAEFTNTNQRIAQAVQSLACSLGHKVSIREGIAKLNGNVIGPKWTVKWVAPEIVFRLTRKAKLQKISTRRTTRFRYITKCEMVSSVPVQCIQVAANDGMFLVGRTFIPTHNSSALLMAALQFVDIPDYTAIIFRLKHSDLALPGALMDRASDWLGGTDARWNGQGKTWRFPSGASLTFGYLDSANDRFRYQSTEFQFVGFDELTQFKETDYTYLFSRQRRLSGSKVPIRMRGATNPGGVGHAWVKKRFLTKQGVEAGRVFIPAKLEDNEYVDIKEYEEVLNELPSFTRKQLRFGVWDDFQGGRFAPAAWPRYVNIGDAFTIMTGMSRRIIYHNECTIIIGVDWAVNKTKRRSAGQSPEWMTEGSSSSDFNSFVVCALSPDGLLFVLDCVNERIRMEDKAKALAEICHKYNPWIVAVDDDMLSEGLILECRRMRGIPELKVLPIGARDKLFRATPAIINAENKRIYLPTPIPNNDYAWMEEFVDQLTSFTGIDDEHDDIADALGIVARVADEVRGDGVEMDDPTILIGGRDVFNGGF